MANGWDANGLGSGLMHHLKAYIDQTRPADITPISSKLDDVIRILSESLNLKTSPASVGVGCSTGKVLPILKSLPLALPASTSETISGEQLLLKMCEEAQGKGFADAIMPCLMPLLAKGNYDGDPEGELRDLTVNLFRIYLASRVFDVNVLGAAQLGSIELVRFSLARGGLALAHADLDDSAIRYLYKAWMSRNTQGRGLHFLRTYLQLQFPNSWQINQLWQPENRPYPDGAARKNVAEKRGKIWLTSRVAVSVHHPTTDKDYLDAVRITFDSVSPARLLPDVRPYIPASTSFQIANLATFRNRLESGGETKPTPVRSANAIHIANSVEIRNRSRRDLTTMPTTTHLSGAVAVANSLNIRVSRYSSGNAMMPKVKLLAGSVSISSSLSTRTRISRRASLEIAA